MTVHLIQRPGERKGSKSKHRSRNSIGSHGSIKDMGLQHKIIDKMFFCMKPNSRLGVFFLISVFIETMDILSSTFNIWLMMKTGFAVEGSLFLLLKVA